MAELLTYLGLGVWLAVGITGLAICFWPLLAYLFDGS
jgi:hypothetical protein